MDNQEYLKVSKEIRNYKMARINVVAILAFTLISFIMYFVQYFYERAIYRFGKRVSKSTRNGSNGRMYYSSDSHSGCIFSVLAFVQKT